MFANFTFKKKTIILSVIVILTVIFSIIIFLNTDLVGADFSEGEQSSLDSLEEEIITNNEHIPESSILNTQYSHNSQTEVPSSEQKQDGALSGLVQNVNSNLDTAKKIFSQVQDMSKNLLPSSESKSHKNVVSPSTFVVDSSSQKKIINPKTSSRDDFNINYHKEAPQPVSETYQKNSIFKKTVSKTHRYHA
ncbi:hypothetical protein AXA84_0040 [Candidatus Phytoplasma oryzae]|uniref:Uncharacterized protein n=1 Tax=Candidatus Phytoplasma oryzae TaxID=203274 RepID=A0A139JQZ8_9MOLU|nr:hypothetical protein [Candidatus Phytoplasma oryzae]KXT29395.1 hypothetical protein AXA84_0040 [Candidatus Phytoplasma oryzae]RAM57978.1 hypothetical protein DH96_00215 [Candidatus Phytoplasma oryzae]